MRLNRKLFLPTLLTLSCFSAPAFAQSDAGKRSFPEIGPEVEVYVPFSSKTRDRFGSTFTGIGIGFGSAVPRAGGQIRPDIAIVRAESGRNEALFVAAGLQYRRTFSIRSQPMRAMFPTTAPGLTSSMAKSKPAPATAMKMISAPEPVFSSALRSDVVLLSKGACAASVL
jgi:hypothetical protein